MTNTAKEKENSTMMTNIVNDKEDTYVMTATAPENVDGVMITSVENVIEGKMDWGWKDVITNMMTK